MKSRAPKALAFSFAVTLSFTLHPVAHAQNCGSGSHNLLANPGFEQSGSIGGGFPSGFGYWGMDRGESVPPTLGIEPFEGQQMLQFLWTGLTDGPAAGRDGAIVQLVDAEPFTSPIDGGTGLATVYARCNRVAGDAETDTQFLIRIRAHSGDPADFIGFDTPVVTATEASLLSDSDPSTWESLTANLDVPSNTQYLSVWVVARENIHNDSVGVEFDGHFADSVVMPEPFSPPCVSLDFVGVYDTTSYVVDSDIVGTTAYVAGYADGLLILDVSNPETPLLLGQFNTSGFAYRIKVVNELAYLADFSDGLRILNVSDPTSPIPVGHVDTPDRAWGLDVVGTLAYVADGSSGLQIIDVADPHAPHIVGAYATSVTRNVAVVGGVAYLCTFDAGLHLIDVTDPTSPGLLTIFKTPSSTRDVCVEDSTAFVACGPNGLVALDVTDPVHPTPIGHFDSIDANDVELGGTFAFIARGEDGIQVLNVCDPSQPTPLAAIDTPGQAIFLTLEGSRLLVSDREGGFRVLEAVDCAACAADLNMDGHLDFFDVAGFLQYFSLGSPEADWNGDGTLDFFDVLQFLEQFSDGCP